MDPATRYTLRRNTASIILFLVLNCGPPGVYTFALPTSYNSTEYGAVATVQCQDGYWYDHNFEKFATVRCTQDGTWKPSPEVIKCTGDDVFDSMFDIHLLVFGVVVKGIAIGAGGLGFDFRTHQIGHSVANSLSPLRCFFGAVLSRRLAAEMDPAARYTLRRNTASITKI